MVEPCAAKSWSKVSSTDLENLPSLVDPKIARHARKQVSLEQDKRSIIGIGDIPLDTLIEAADSEVVGIDAPDISILGACGS
jgi:hypothetical protein